MRTCWRRLREGARLAASLEGHAERLLFVRVCLFAPWVRVLMRLRLPWLDPIVTWLARPAPDRATIAPERVAHIVGLAQQWGHPFVARGCVTRGVSLLWILRRRGLDVQLAFGIGGPADEHQGHCWLIRDDQPYLEKEAFGDRFVEVFRVPAARIP